MAVEARLLAVVPVVAVLAWMSAHAVCQAIAGAAVHDASLAVGLWRAGVTPASETISRVREDLTRALDRDSSNAAVHELLGILDARAGTPESLGQARARFVNALQARPSSPYSWANLAAVDYRLGLTSKSFEKALIRAAQWGPYEPEVQRAVAFFGLAVWDEIASDTRAAVDGAVAAGLRRNPPEMLQIARSRGRLREACRHFAGSPRVPDPKWSQICHSTEVTS